MTKEYEEYIHRYAAECGCISGVCDMAGGRSVIVFGKGYEPSPYRNLSSLGHGMDYHVVLTGILENLASYLNCKSTIQVDSGKIKERPLAVKAGLGFFGRSGMVISPILGSFFNIGLLITDIYLRPTPPIDARCPEDCRRCIEACPAGAIGDYKRCNSYLTQKKGGQLITNCGQLYGCDLCQLCCPFNKITQPTEEIDPEEIISMTEEDFDKRFGHTAMAWRGLQHLQKNARIQLAKKGDNNGTLEHKGSAGQCL